MRVWLIALAVVAGLAATAEAEHPRWGAPDRFDPRVARFRVERELARQPIWSQPIEIVTPYLPRTEGDRDLDYRIRRLGELIRRQEPDGR
jgi:hypothetical protein